MEQSPWIIPPEPRTRPTPARRQAAHLSALFEGFIAFMSVERDARPATIRSYRYCFSDFVRFAEAQLRAPLLASGFSTDLVKAYQYHLAHRQLSSNTIRGRLAVLAALGKWAARAEKLQKNPLDQIVRPPRRFKLPETLRWDAVQNLIERTERLRDKALLAVMVYGGLRRSEVVALDVSDFDPAFGLRRVLGKGGSESAVPLGNDARSIISRYLLEERASTKLTDPLFAVSYLSNRGKLLSQRLTSHRLYKLIRQLGKEHGIPKLHPHALRHACAVELLKRTNNLAAVQQHLRHVDVRTTTIYARLLPRDLQEIVKVFDRNQGDANK